MRYQHPSERGFGVASGLCPASPHGGGDATPKQRIESLTRCAVGYDISASASESTSVGSRAGEGDFIVYGSNRNPPWVTYAILAAAAFFIWKFFFKR